MTPRIALAGVLAALLVPAPADAAAMPTWNVTPGDGKITLEPCLRAPAARPVPPGPEPLTHQWCRPGRPGDAIGTTTLMVRNDGDDPVALRLSYTRADGASARLPGPSTIALLEGHPRSKQAPPATVPGHSLTALRLRFALPEGLPPSTLSGVVEVRDPNDASAVASVTLAPAAATAAAGVKVDPASVTLSTAAPDQHVQRVVKLQGLDSLGYLAGTRAARLVTLSDGQNHVAFVKVMSFARDPSDRTLAKAEISYDPKTGQHLHAGVYSGTVSPFGAGGPAIAVKLQAGSSRTRGWLLVFIGTVAGLVAAGVLSPATGWRKLSTWVIGLVVVPIPLIVFTLAVYSQTWGGFGDALAAFGIGFGLGATLALLGWLLFAPVSRRDAARPPSG